MIIKLKFDREAREMWWDSSVVKGRKSKYGGGSSPTAVEEGHEPRVVAGRPLVGQA